MTNGMNPSIQQLCVRLSQRFEDIPPERRSLLDQLSAYINSKLQAKEAVQLVYVCTHNSRRSHFGQIWAKVASRFYGIPSIDTYSGGTEATAFHPHAIAALQRVGFTVSATHNGPNPKYHVVYDQQEPPLIAFSKLYNDAANPKAGFAAVMTCSEAEQNCPFIPGAELRLASTYEDPKVFDGTPAQDAAYDERCLQIALECLYVFSKVNPNTA